MSQKKYCKPREVWVTNLSGTQGREQRGIRPVLVLKHFSKDLFLGVPITSKDKGKRWCEPIIFNDMQTISFCILSQVRVMDRSRVKRRVGKVSQDYLQLIYQRLIGIIKP